MQGNDKYWVKIYSPEIYLPFLTTYGVIKSDYMPLFQISNMQSDIKENNLKERNLKERNLKENNLKENNIKENNLKERNLKENNLKENNIKENNLKENNLKELNLNENNLKDLNPKENNLKEIDVSLIRGKTTLVCKWKSNNNNEIIIDVSTPTEKMKVVYLSKLVPSSTGEISLSCSLIEGKVTPKHTIALLSATKHFGCKRMTISNIELKNILNMA